MYPFPAGKLYGENLNLHGPISTAADSSFCEIDFVRDFCLVDDVFLFILLFL